MSFCWHCYFRFRNLCPKSHSGMCINKSRNLSWIYFGERCYFLLLLSKESLWSWHLHKAKRWRVVWSSLFVTGMSPRQPSLFPALSWKNSEVLRWYRNRIFYRGVEHWSHRSISEPFGICSVFYGGIFFAIIESVGIVSILSVGVSAYKRLWEPKMYPTHNIVYRMNCFI